MTNTYCTTREELAAAFARKLQGHVSNSAEGKQTANRAVARLVGKFNVRMPVYAADWDARNVLALAAM